MTVHTQVDATLVLQIGGTDYACQVISGTLTWPAAAEATQVPVACGDVVSEPGDMGNGSITGDVYKDTTAVGITRALITALEAQSELTYSWQEAGMTTTGRCRVAGHDQTFTPDKYGRHPLNLTVITATTAWS